jgi:hypothetical protein
MPPGYSARATSRARLQVVREEEDSDGRESAPDLLRGDPGLPKTVGGHTNNVFRKLDIDAEPAHHRRGVAVLTFLRARGA